MVVLNPGDESWGNDGFRSWPRYRPYTHGMVKHLTTDFNRIERTPLVATSTFASASLLLEYPDTIHVRLGAAGRPGCLHGVVSEFVV